MWNLLIAPIVSTVGAIFTSWLDRKKIEAEGAVKVAVARAEAEAVELKTRAAIMEKTATADIEWDQLWAKQAEHSWKDEWFTILVSIPLVLAFFPSGRDVVTKGFAALEAMPVWYQITLGVVVGAAFGYRKLADIFSTMRRK